MKTYEYIAFSSWNDEPTKEEILEKIENGDWDKLCSNSGRFDLVAEQILEENYIDWKCSSGCDDEIFVIVREKNNKGYWELYCVSVDLRARSEHILCSDDK
ncbi:hypothetical protein [Volucribacter amazonae]|uniref:Uncharacterized protein n=1 Tax=Volucribacter amazonae TaxID=256731 RepID=A0A9X4SL07_9PAST|nr:hypothetical protein [Volucribacter amazonae]MDG6894568.1 hypothetical protein [Volucribacter amazonae]